MLSDADIKIGTLVTVDMDFDGILNVYESRKHSGHVGEIINIEYTDNFYEQLSGKFTDLKIIRCKVWWPVLNKTNVWFHGFLKKL